MKKLILEDKRKAPIENIIIEEENRKRREIEDSWKMPQPQPTVYDRDPLYIPPEKDEKKESERGVWKAYS